MINILITGATGFLGSHLIPLLEQDFTLYITPRPQYDLRQSKHIEKLLVHSKPDIIIHLAADVGGLRYNIDNPASIYYNNVMMNTQLIHQSAIFGVKKFIFVSSVCAYPLRSPLPTREHHLWAGYPESSNGSYGISKRIALTQLEAYRDQWGMQFEYPILANLYGPGDKSDHVIPMLVRKFLNANIMNKWATDAHDNVVEIWGDGSATRDFLYVTDAARAIKKLIEISIGDAVNIASGNSIPIKLLVEYLAEITGFNGEIVYDYTKPTGQQQRSYNIDRATEYLNWTPEVSIKDGLKKMVEYQRTLLSS